MGVFKKVQKLDGQFKVFNLVIISMESLDIL